MEWTRSETIGLASMKCVHCRGLGLREARGRLVPCACVFRSIFRACYARFRKCVEQEKRYSRVSLEYSPRGGRRITWGMKNEEYIADFYLVSRRHLTPAEWEVFRYHFLLGADSALCVRKLKIDRGQFFHMVYRIEAKLGKVFRELQPYSLYPLDEYFYGRTENPWRPEDPPEAGKKPAGSGGRRDIPVKRVA
jgi:hypothetical protein